YLRTRLVERLVTGATNTYLQDREAIFGYARTKALLEYNSEESELCAALKEFARVHAYLSPTVLEIEYRGSGILHDIMDDLWHAISGRKSFADPSSRRTTPKASFVYSLISDSYRWHFERIEDPGISIRYRELQLLTDMVSGMTDGYAIDLHERIRRNASS